MFIIIYIVYIHGGWGLYIEFRPRPPKIQERPWVPFTYLVNILTNKKRVLEFLARVHTLME
jgi:hypothetical protein